MTNLTVTTSWDDGHKLDLRMAGLLTKYGLRGTFYITKYYLEPLERWDVVELSREHEIGAHTLNHVNLTNVSLLKARDEIAGSKGYLEYLLGHSPVMFCYPYGEYNKSVKQIVRRCGFSGARTCRHGGFGPPRDPHEWQITLHASNGSPLTTLRMWGKCHLSLSSLGDWETRAKLLFDMALERGGVYHLWGHSWEIDKNGEWDKLERVFGYISRVRDVRFMTNGEIFASLPLAEAVAHGR
jgi:peptidoglycan/xylan/chitin deacetylase (PgdA/CDA1 family)